MKDDFGDRMKSYEKVFNHKLMKKMPVIIFIDGKAFHTFTRGLRKPFDETLITTMRETTQKLCEKIQGCKLGYVQSDEISLLLTDWETYETSAWFDYRIQKISSVVASMATAFFNKSWEDNVRNAGQYYGIDPETREWDGYKFMNRTALFDARCFNIPRHEVKNWFLWRNRDWIRNSKQMLARSFFSQKQLTGKNQGKMIEMLKEVGVNWYDLEGYEQYGTFYLKKDDEWIPKTEGIKSTDNWIEELLKPEP